MVRKSLFRLPINTLILATVHLLVSETIRASRTENQTVNGYW